MRFAIISIVLPCYTIKYPYHLQCHKSVNQTGAILHAIEKKLNPTAICAALKICPKEEAEEASVFEDLLKIATSGSAPTCSICKIAVESVQEETNAGTVRDALKDTCNGISLFAGKKVVMMKLFMFLHIPSSTGRGDLSLSKAGYCLPNVTYSQWRNGDTRTPRNLIRWSHFAGTSLCREGLSFGRRPLGLELKCPKLRYATVYI